MPTQLRLLDHATRDDLRVFLERLQRAGQAQVRLLATGEQLAVFGCTQSPAGLLDTVPVVLVLRSFGLARPVDGSIDVTVEGRAVLDRLARIGVVGLELELPETTVTATWAGVLPPVAGWQEAGAIEAGSLATVAEQGIDRVAQLLPEQPGEAVVRKVRASVWGLEVAPGVPAAAAFAAASMGFLQGEAVVRLAKSLTWTRLHTSRGEVVVRSLLG